MRSSYWVLVYTIPLTISSYVFWKYQIGTFDGYTLHETSLEFGVVILILLGYAILREVEDQ
jgi:hypothetical protein